MYCHFMRMRARRVPYGKLSLLRFSCTFVLAIDSILIQVAQLSQRDRAAGWVSYGQKWKTVNGRQYFTDIIGLSSTTMT